MHSYSLDPRRPGGVLMLTMLSGLIAILALLVTLWTILRHVILNPTRSILRLVRC